MKTNHGSFMMYFNNAGSETYQTTVMVANNFQINVGRQI